MGEEEQAQPAELLRWQAVLPLCPRSCGGWEAPSPGCSSPSLVSELQTGLKDHQWKDHRRSCPPLELQWHSEKSWREPRSDEALGATEEQDLLLMRGGRRLAEGALSKGSGGSKAGTLCGQRSSHSYWGHLALRPGHPRQSPFWGDESSEGDSSALTLAFLPTAD